MNSVKILKLYTYPIKSFPGIDLSMAQITSRGVRDDRRWMLIDEHNNFVTQRYVPELTQFKLVLEGVGYRLSHPSDSRSFYFAASDSPELQEKVVCTIWRSKVKSHVVYPEISQWLSETLNRNLRMVQFAPDEKRNVNGHKHSEIYYADGHPILVVGTASIDDLNSKIDHSVSQLNFRPNILVETKIPFIEDEFEKLSSQAVRFENTKLCGRCKIITLDPETGVYYPDTFTTLAGFRMIDKGVKFGNYFKVISEGELKMGDELSF